LKANILVSNFTYQLVVSLPQLKCIKINQHDNGIALTFPLN
jgi:hypothetical protein